MFFVLFPLYRLLLWGLSPALGFVTAVHPRLRGQLAERWGFGRPEVEPGAVWIHAASLGEGRAASALIVGVRQDLGDVEIVRTCTSPTARDQAVGADQTLYAPIDHPVAVGAFLDRLRPRCLVLVEAELWPVTLEACRARGIPIAVVNARLGPGQLRLLRLPTLFAWLTRGILWTAPDAATAATLGGLPVGDLKAEAPAAVPTLVWSRPTIVAGSTHDGEEQALVRAVAGLLPRPMLVLAPRDPRRFDAVWDGLDQVGAARRTQLDGVVPPEVDVLLLDTIGELGALYGPASAAFVGGTFLKDVGGHSPAEAIAAGCPVVHGPHTHANVGAWAGISGFLAASPDELGIALAAALGAGRKAPGEGGAVASTVRALRPLWAAEAGPERMLRPWLWPWTLGWRAALWWRAWRRTPVRVPGGKVVSVGSLAAGGAGKTPVAAWIAEVVGGVVVARGYGRDDGGDVRTEGEAAQLGDEMAMLSRRGAGVVSSPDRVRGVARVFGGGAKVAVLDDGLQVVEVARDLEVVVVDVRFPGGDGMVPAGTRRLPLRWLRRADVVWLSHATAETPVPKLLRPFVRSDALIVRANYEPLCWLFHGERRPLDAIPCGPIAVFVGIARPEGFFRQLRRLGLRVDHRRVFPDHHRFSEAELEALEAWRGDRLLVTTEKDSARLPSGFPVWALCVAVRVHGGEQALRERLGGMSRAG